MQYNLMLVSRRPYEPEEYWEQTDRGLALFCFIANSNRQQQFITSDINRAFHQLELCSVKLNERSSEFPSSDYYWVVNELPDITMMGDVSGSTIGVCRRCGLSPYDPKWKSVICQHTEGPTNLTIPVAPKTKLQIEAEDAMIGKNVSEFQSPETKDFINSLSKMIDGDSSFTKDETKLYIELLQAFSAKKDEHKNI